MEDERFFFLINGSGSGIRLSLEKQSKTKYSESFL